MELQSLAINKYQENLSISDSLKTIDDQIEEKREDPSELTENTPETRVKVNYRTS